MTRRLACADFTFPLLAHEKALQLIAMLEFEGVDIGLFEGRSHLWPSREFERLEGSARELLRQMEDAGLQAADIFLQMAPDFSTRAVNHPESARRHQARDGLLKTLEYASICGCEHVTALPGVHYDDEPYAASYARCVEELAWRVERAEKQGIVFGVEAHVGSIVPDPESAEALVKSVPGLTLTLDYTHFIRADFPESAAEKLVPYASHFHVRGARRGRLQASFKENVIDYARVARAMDACGYRGWVGIEYVWIDWEQCNECDNLSETILFRDFFRKT